MPSRRSRCPPSASRRVYHDVVIEPASQPFIVLDDDPPGAPAVEPDPAAIVLTCANCGSPMDERKCKLICSCGYFASCSDYY